MASKKKFNLIKEWRNNKDHLKWILKQSKGFNRYVTGFLLISLLSMLVSLASSVTGKYVVDAATGFKTDLFWKYILIMLGMSLFTIVLSFFTTLFSNYVSEKFAFSIRAEMFDRVQRSKWLKINKFHSGDILSRLTGDIGTLASSIISIVPTVVVAFIEFIIILGILLYYDPTMAVIGLIVGPLGLIAGTILRRKYVKYHKALRESESEYYSFFQESLSNLTVTKTFQTEDDNNEYLKDLRKKRLSLVMKSSRLGAFMNVSMRVIYTLGYIAAFSWCAYRLSRNDGYTYGDMTLFLSLVGTLQNTIRGIGSIIPQTFSTLVAAKRIRAITDIEDEEYSDNADIPESVGLHIDNVSFTYETAKVLNNISIDVKSGDRVGIVGTSGAGKTTFIRLLLSLIEPESGEAVYTVDGNRETISPVSRRFISYVPQGNSLLSGTIRHNLLIADKSATDEEMWEALKLADAADFVRSCPDGLDTELSEKAGGLSEGQAQRIAIARALLRNKPVLILDEATSALDEDTEKKIFERLTEIKGKTCFIITHRKSMLRYCNYVFEIDDNGCGRMTQNK